MLQNDTDPSVNDNSSDVKIVDNFNLSDDDFSDFDANENENENGSCETLNNIKEYNQKSIHDPN